jgi:hypothetical protein
MTDNTFVAARKTGKFPQSLAWPITDPPVRKIERRQSWQAKWARRYAVETLLLGKIKNNFSMLDISSPNILWSQARRAAGAVLRRVRTNEAPNRWDAALLKYAILQAISILLKSIRLQYALLLGDSNERSHACPDSQKTTPPKSITPNTEIDKVYFCASSSGFSIACKGTVRASGS